MTVTSQKVHATAQSRRKQVMAHAYDYVVAQNLSPEMRRALLGAPSGNGQPSKRPAYLRLYFALKAQSFTTSAQTRAVAAKQKADKEQARLERLADRKARSQERKAKFAPEAAAQQRVAAVVTGTTITRTVRTAQQPANAGTRTFRQPALLVR